MRSLLPICMLLANVAVAQDDMQAGLQLYAEGRYDAAAAALRQAEASAAESPELQYNLALASWRAGDLPTAETAIEKYAALSRKPRVDLHAGLLGAVRFEEARRLEAAADAASALPAGAPGGAQPQDPLPLLEQALAKAKQAQEHFVRGTVAAGSPELRRNTERALRYIAALQKKIDELEKQREQQKDEKQDDQKNDDEKKDDSKDSDKKDGDKGKDEKSDEKNKDEKSNDEKSNDEKANPDPAKGDDPKSDPSKPDQSKPGQEGQQGEPPQQAEAPEPKPDAGEQPSKGQGSGEPPPEPSGEPPQQAPDQSPGAPPRPRHDAPGEQQEAHELSPEQTQRLLELLQQLDGQLDGIRARAKSRRPKVEKDW